FPARNMHQSLVYEEKIWIIGGYDAGFAKNDVWYSLDAANWSTASDQAPFSFRRQHGATVFQNKIWILGGEVAGSLRHDVWVSK
ncbi:MAG: hypothetical protein GY866_18725, partial [Proteobacteria bacterium]|nr:hypothetical protein [Pseudomonadota bacterium]